MGIIMGCIGPEKITLLERGNLAKQIAQMVKDIDDVDAICGSPAWLVNTVAKTLRCKQTTADFDDCGRLLAIWDGLENDNNPVNKQIMLFVKRYGRERLIHIPISSGRRLDAVADLQIDVSDFEHDVFLCTCQADYKETYKISGKLKSFRAPHMVACKIGHNQIQNMYFSSGDTLTDDDKSALNSSRILLIACSPASEQCGKNREAVALFSAVRGRRYIHTALLEGDPSESFPLRLMMEEDYIDPQTNETIHMSGEPLAADFRKPMRGQSRNNESAGNRQRRELLRLLAPVFECAFDDLYRRKQQQTRQRVATVLMVVLAIGIITASVLGLLMTESVASAAIQQMSATRAGDAADKAKEAQQEAARKAQEAIDADSAAVTAQCVRYTREARIAFENGNRLLALRKLLDATLETELTWEMPLETEALLRTVVGSGVAVPLLRISGASDPLIEDGKLYCRMADGSAVQFDLHTGEEFSVDTLPHSTMDNIEISASIQGLTMILEQDGTAYLTDESGSLLESFQAHSSKPLGVFAVSEEQLLVSFSADETVVWGLLPNNKSQSIQAHDGAIRDLWLGETMIATAGIDGRVCVFDFSGKQLLTLEAGVPLSTVEIREEVSLALTCGSGGEVMLWDLITGQHLWSVSIPNAGVARLSPDGAAIVAGRRYESSWSVYEDYRDNHPQVATLLRAGDGSIVTTVECSCLPWYGEIFREDTFVTGQYQRAIGIYSIQTGGEIETIEFQYYEGVATHFSPFNYIMDSYSNIIASPEREEIRPSYVLDPHSKLFIPSPVDSITFLDVGQDFTAMFNTISHEPIKDPDYIATHSYRHRDEVLCAAMSIDGVYGITASRDGTAAILSKDGAVWVIDCGAPVIESGFSPDVGQVITANETGVLAIMPLGTFDDLRGKAERLVLR